MSDNHERETVDQTLAFQLGRRAALQDVDRMLDHRAAITSPGPEKAECLSIRASVIRPLLHDAAKEAELLSLEEETRA